MLSLKISYTPYEERLLERIAQLEATSKQLLAAGDRIFQRWNDNGIPTFADMKNLMIVLAKAREVI